MTDAIVPDDKDWTWVLERPCPECGFDASAASPFDVAGMIRQNAGDWEVVLDQPADVLRERTDPARWTTLEYAAHVRDVYRLYRERLALMIDTDDPLFANWDQDMTAREERYNDQDPIEVAAELAVAAEHLADAFDALAPGEWTRPGRRSDGASFTVDTFSRYLIHDPVHHLWDVARSI